MFPGVLLPQLQLQVSSPENCSDRQPKVERPLLSPDVFPLQDVSQPMVEPPLLHPDEHLPKEKRREEEFRRGGWSQVESHLVAETKDVMPTDANWRSSWRGNVQQGLATLPRRRLHGNLHLHPRLDRPRLLHDLHGHHIHLEEENRMREA